MKKMYYWFFVLIFAFTSVFFSFYPNLIDYSRTPLHHIYSFAFGHTGDYYQFLYYISQGMKGNFLYTLPYTPVPGPPLIIVPVYFIFGFIVGNIVHSPVVVMQFIRIISLVLLWIAFGLVVKKTITFFSMRILALLFFLLSGSLWNVSMQGENWIYTFPLEGNDGFQILTKFIAPSNLLHSISLYLLVIYVFTSLKSYRNKVFLSFLLVLLSGLSHPYIMPIIVLSIAITELWLFINRKIGMYKFFSALVSSVSAALIIYAYYYVMTPQVYPWIQAQQVISFSLTSLEGLKLYLQSLGLGIFTCILSFFAFNKRRFDSAYIMLLLWVFIPVIAYIFGMNQLIQSFKSYQYIPLAILTCIGVEFFLRAYKPSLILVPIFYIGITAYSVGPLLQILKQHYESNYQGLYQIYTPEPLYEVFEYLRKNTPVHSYVLAPEILSYMIPVYTNNRVIIGQGNSRFDYIETKNKVDFFYSGYMQEEDATAFLRENKVEYILFNLGTNSFEKSLSKYNFLKQVFMVPSSVQIVRVDIPYE